MKYFTLILLLAAGCTTRSVTFPTKDGPLTITSKRFGVKESFTDIEIHQGTNSFIVRGTKSDLVTGLEIVTKAAIETAVKATKP